MINTAGGTANNYIKRTGYGSFPSNAGDWTIFLRFRITATPAVAVNLLSLFDGPTDFSGPYVYFGTGVNGTDQINVEINNTSFTETANFVVVHGTQYWAGITYEVATHKFTFTVNGVVIGTAINDVSSAVWDSLFLLGDTSVVTDGAASVGYCFAWSSAKTLVQLTAQAASITPLTTSDLIWSNPLQTSTDLTSHNNTLNQLSAVGVVTTDTVDPLLSVIAGPPTNIDPNTATLVTYDSAVFQDTLTAGAATDVWHKAVALVGDKIWGASAFGDLVTYKPNIVVYDGLVNALANSPLLTNNPNLPVQFPVTVGNTYYFKSARNAAVTPATLKLSILKGLTIPCPIGTYAIPDVTDGFPLALLDEITIYPINWKNDFPAGEEVGILSNGKILVEDSTDLGTKLFDAQLNQLAIPSTGDRFEVTGSNNSQFAMGKAFGGADQFKLVDEFGVVGGTTYSIGAGGFKAITLSPDATIAYIEQITSGGTNTPVKKFVLATSTLSNFVAGIVGFSLAPNAICLSDGTVLVGYNTIPSIACKVLRYNADGTTANTYNLAADDQIERIADYGDGIHFVVWSQPSTQFSRFYKIKVSDGTVVRTVDNVQKYNDGQYKAGVAVINTPVRFGHSFSCPLWTTRAALFASVNQRSGIYTLSGTGADFSTANPRLTHDVVYIDASLGTTQNMAIPTPFGETFLAGDQ